MPPTTSFAAAVPPRIEPAPQRAAALLFLTPLLLSAHGVRAGLQLGFAVLATLLVLQAVLRLYGTTRRHGAFAATLWSTVAAAAASWLLPAYGMLDQPQIALLPLIAANAAWWNTYRTQSGIALGACSLVLALAGIAAGLLRSGADAFAADSSSLFISGLTRWLASPPGLAITAALVIALWQYLRLPSAAAPERDINAP